VVGGNVWKAHPLVRKNSASAPVTSAPCVPGGSSAGVKRRGGSCVVSRFSEMLNAGGRRASVVGAEGGESPEPELGASAALRRARRRAAARRRTIEPPRSELGASAFTYPAII